MSLPVPFIPVALTDGTDLKAFRRGHPVLLGPPPSPFGHEFCGVDVANGRRVVAAGLQSFQFENQIYYPKNIVLNPGDRVRTKCDYMNTGNKLVTLGLDDAGG